MALETPEINRYDKMLLLDDRTSTQIQVVASGVLSKHTKALQLPAKIGRDQVGVPWAPWCVYCVR